MARRPTSGASAEGRSQFDGADVGGTSPDDMPMSPPQGYRVAEHNWQLQQIMEIQKALGGLTAEVRNVVSTLDRHDGKLDKIGELSANIAHLSAGVLNMSATVERLGTSVKDQGGKLDSVRLQVAAIVGGIVLLGAVAGVIIKVWPDGKHELPSPPLVSSTLQQPSVSVIAPQKLGH